MRRRSQLQCNLHQHCAQGNCFFPVNKEEEEESKNEEEEDKEEEEE